MNKIEKYREIIISAIIILLVISFQILSYMNKDVKIEFMMIEDINDYGNKIVNKEILPNAIVARVNNEPVYKYEVDMHDYSIKSSDDTQKNAFYEVLKQKILIQKYGDSNYFEDRKSLYNKIVENMENITDLEYEKILQMYGIEENEKWCKDEEMKKIILDDLLNSYIYSSTLTRVTKDAKENIENFTDENYLNKLKLLNNNWYNQELTNEVIKLYIEQLILNSNIKFYY